MGQDRRQLPRDREQRGPGKRVGAWLDWSRSNAPILRQIELRKKKHADEGKPPPKLSTRERAVLASRPELDFQASFTLTAWQTLDSMRPHGVRPVPVPKSAPILMPYQGAIPWDAIRTFGKDHGLDRAGIDLLVETIARLDFERSERETSEIRTKGKR